MSWALVSFSWMVGAQLGYNWPGSQLEASLIYGAHVGYRFGYQFFTTVSYDHFNAKYESNKAFSVQEKLQGGRTMR